MITITAIIQAKPGQADNLKHALLAVADNVAENEPETVGFFICQDTTDPMILTTYERFTSEQAKNAHNNTDAVSVFFDQADALIEGPVILRNCEEISQK
jgi:quinol monooxygenase YgiN